MDILHAVALGIVEGLTEFLPVSSTGHLILASDLLAIPQTEFLKTFEIVIQLGAIGAVLFVYFRKLFNIELLKQLFVAFIPTAVIGLALYKVVKTYLLGNEIVVLAALFIGGVLLIIFEWWYSKREVGEVTEMEIERIGYKKSLALGFFQAIAIIPGVSRSGATILGGLLMGIPRKTIVEFSFLLAVPTMAAATGLDLIKSYSQISSADIRLLLIGLIASFIVALASIKWLLSYVQKHSFIPFGIYRIVVALLFWFIVL